MPSNLNQLYAEYKAARREMDPDDNGDGKFDPLLEAVTDYALNLATRSGYHSPGDLAQEVVSKVWRNLEKFDGRSSFKTWVCSIARNYLYDQARQCARQGDPLDFSALEDGDYVAEYEPTPHRNFKALPSRIRIGAEMLSAGYTQEQTANHLGVSVKTLRRDIFKHAQTLLNASKDAALSNFV